MSDLWVWEHELTVGEGENTSILERKNYSSRLVVFGPSVHYFRLPNGCTICPWQDMRVETTHI